MTETGRLIASGRDSDIFEYGPGRVLRRSRESRSMETEARMMQHVQAHGFPVPVVDDVLRDGTEIVMERIDGPTMIDDLTAHPWRIGRHARALADLHQSLHQIPAPEWLDPAPDGGSCVVHLDLHPINVLLSKRGPVLIDWANARRGDGLSDVALTWVLIATGQAPGGPLRQVLIRALRSLLLRSFLSHFDAAALSAIAPSVARMKAEDANMSSLERRAMLRLAEHHEARVRRPGRQQ